MTGLPTRAAWARFRSDRAREIGLSYVLALEIATMFVIAPLAATGVLPPTLLDLCRLGLAAAAVVLLSRSWLVSALIGGGFLASLLLSIGARSAVAVTAVGLERIAAATFFDLAIAWTVALVAFGHGRVTVHRIMGAVILYLSIALVFGSAYRAAALLLHPSFSGLSGSSAHFFSQSLYFSLSTLTTTGYGDITPVHPFIRSLANLEAVIGQLFPATLVARLVTLNAAGAAKPR